MRLEYNYITKEYNYIQNQKCKSSKSDVHNRSYFTSCIQQKNRITVF